MHVYEPKKMFGSGNLACYFSLKPDFFIHMYMYLKKKAFSVFLKPYIAPGYVNYKKGALDSHPQVIPVACPGSVVLSGFLHH
jgi:hypothetical protein